MDTGLVVDGLAGERGRRGLLQKDFYYKYLVEVVIQEVDRTQVA